jgi:hypothetical protein
LIAVVRTERSFVRSSVTIIVCAIARFDTDGADAGLRVITIATALDVHCRRRSTRIHARRTRAKAITVSVAIVWAKQPFIDHRVAIIVATIANLWDPRVHGCERIIAVECVAGPTVGCTARAKRLTLEPISIAIAISVIESRDTFVDELIAIFVGLRAVADLFARLDATDATISEHTHHANLCAWSTRSDAHQRCRRTAFACIARAAWATFVGGTAAIVVDPIADVTGSWVDGVVAVIAVVATSRAVTANTRGRPVTIGIHEAERFQVAILVMRVAVADLDVPRISIAIVVVAVVTAALFCCSSITVSV